MIPNFSNAINKAYISMLNAMYTFLFKIIENRRLNITCKLRDWSPKFETRLNIIIGIVQKV